MFQQLRVNVLGIVENMSYMVIPETAQRIDVFGQGGGKRTAEAMQVPFLGELPLDPEIRIGGDRGKPITLEDEGRVETLFRSRGAGDCESAKESAASKGPSISIAD